jgi:uncharacterized protein YbbK (DUF523 family)
MAHDKQDNNMNDKPTLGISGCLTGAAVRFDGGHKRMGFIMDELAEWVTFKPVCPEMALACHAAPALRLVNTTAGDTRLRFSLDLDKDLTEKMHHFADGCLPMRRFCRLYCLRQIPSCGMERVRLYDEQGNRGPKKALACLPRRCASATMAAIEEDGGLTTRFCARTLWRAIFALHELNTLRQNGINRSALLAFHSRYKLHLLAHSQPGYRKSAFIARIMSGRI